jgi:hypothetical protein
MREQQIPRSVKKIEAAILSPHSDMLQCGVKLNCLKFEAKSLSLKMNKDQLNSTFRLQGNSSAIITQVSCPLRIDDLEVAKLSLSLPPNVIVKTAFFVTVQGASDSTYRLACDFAWLPFYSSGQEFNNLVFVFKNGWQKFLY